MFDNVDLRMKDPALRVLDVKRLAEHQEEPLDISLGRSAPVRPEDFAVVPPAFRRSWMGFSVQSSTSALTYPLATLSATAPGSSLRSHPTTE